MNSINAEYPPYSIGSFPAKGEQDGYIALILIIPLSIIGFLSYQTTVHVQELLAIKGLFRHQLVAENRLVRDIATLSLGMRGCNEVHVSTDSFLPSTWHICIFKESDFMARPATTLPSGTPNYSEILKSPSTCPYTRRPLTKTTFTTPEASTTCEVQSIALEHDLILHDNIHGVFATINSTNERARTIIASPGLIHFEEGLHTNTPLLIIAGGAISIPTITSDASATIPVTLLSAHGDIAVSSQGSNVALLAIGRKLLDTPPPRSFTGVFPLPHFSALDISGFISSE